MTDTFLPPIEQPDGLIKKLAYYFTRRQFGKVLTPVKVHSARLPPAFGLFYAKIAKLDEKLELPRELVMLIRERVAQINVCLFCIDIGRWYTIQQSMNQAKFDALDDYATSPLFTEAERAALALAEEGTRLGDASHGVSDETWAQVRKHYDDDQVAALVCLVAMINAANRLGVIVQQKGGSYQLGMLASLTS